MLGCFVGGLLLVSMRTPVDDLPFRESLTDALRVAKSDRKAILYADDPGTWGLADSRLAAFLSDPKGKSRIGQYVLIHTRRGYRPSARDRSLDLDPEVPSFVWLDENGEELQRSIARISVSRFLLMDAYADAALTRRRKAPSIGTLDHQFDRLSAGNPVPAIEAVRKKTLSAGNSARLALALADHFLARGRVHSAGAWLRQAEGAGLPPALQGKFALAHATLNSFRGELGKAMTDLELALKQPLDPTERDYASSALRRLRNRIGSTLASR